MNFISKILDLLFPAACSGCQSPLLNGSGLCNKCWSQLRFFSPPWCEKCGSPGDPRMLSYSCKGCVHYRRAYDKLRTGISFDEISKVLIHQLKYHDKTMLAPLLANLVQRSAADYSDADMIIPVPIHRTKLRQRKYNQAALLAKELAKIMGKPCYMDLLQRSKDTTSQVGLSSAARRRNVRDAFQVNAKYATLLAGKTIILVDDVISTGATVHECAKCLKSAGAGAVYVVCVARNEITAPPPDKYPQEH